MPKAGEGGDHDGGGKVSVEEIGLEFADDSAQTERGAELCEGVGAAGKMQMAQWECGIDGKGQQALVAIADGEQLVAVGGLPRRLRLLAMTWWWGLGAG